MKKIIYVSGTRADYGLMRLTLLCLRRHPALGVEVLVTGMHLMPEFGKTISEIKKDKFKIHRLEAIYKKDNKPEMVNFIGEFMLKFNRIIKKNKIDLILLLGDRAEMLAAAIVGAYLMIPVVHIHGGDVTSTVDEVARHAITKLAHLHLVATPNARNRVIRMGEDPWRVHVVGAPGLDEILHEKMLSKNEITKKYNIDLSEPFFLVIQHPVTAEEKEAAAQMYKTMEVVKEIGCQAVIIYPNADPGGRRMIRIIERYRKFPFIKIYKNIPRKDYLSLMQIASVMIGNSSAGIIEASSFHLPVVNIGTRQEGRERSENIIDVAYDKKQIIKALRKSLSINFRRSIQNIKPPYGCGNAGERIADILAHIKVNKRLIQKKLAY